MADRRGKDCNWHPGWQKKYGKERFPSPDFALAPQGRIPKACRRLLSVRAAEVA